MSTVRIQVRRGTAQQWDDADPVLEAGEIGFESDTNKFKFGNGDDAWSVLDYAAPGLTDFNNTLDDYLTVGLRGTANGVASLNSSTKIPNDQIDSTTWATRSLVRATVSGLQLHENVTYATTSELAATYSAGTTDWFGGTAIGARLTLNATGILTIDGTTMPVNARVLVKDQTNKLHNGLYTVTTAGATGVAAVLTRTDDASDEFSPAIYGGSIVFVQLGSSNSGKQFVQLIKGTAANKGIVVGTDIMEWTQYSGAATITAGTGISITGDEVSIHPDYQVLSGTVSTHTTQISGLDSLVSDLQDDVSGHTTTLTSKANLEGPTFTGTVSLPSTTSIGDVSSTEIGYVNGVTSAIQTQMDAKAPTNSPTFTGTVSGVTKAMVGLGDVDNTADSAKPVSTATQTALDLKQDKVSGVTDTEIGYLDGVTSAIQTQIDGKQAIISGVTNTELGYLDGVTSAIQTQIDAKASLSGATFTGNVEVDGSLVVDGDFTVNGTNFSASATSITIEDNMLQLAHQNAANTVDLGLVVAYNDGTAKHSGLVRDVSDAKWKLFKGVTSEPSTTVDFTQGSLDDLKVAAFEATTVTPSSGVVFSDGTQTKEGVASRTPIIQKTGSYTLSSLTERDSLIEVSSATGVTITIPADATLNFPVGTSIDILQTSTGQVTIAGSGFTPNATPGLKLRTQWSSCTLFKRAADTWVVMGDLSA